MPLRTILLRVLFCSLALAAVFGAVGILFASHDAIWRIAATSIATAGAALLLLVASSKMDKPVPRPAALLGATLVVIEYLLALAAIWEMAIFFGSQYDDSLWLTILFIALTGVPAIAFLRMMTKPITAWAGRAGLALAAAELAMLLTVAWGGSFWSGNSTFETLAAWLPPFALLAVICLIGQGDLPRRPWRWIGIVAAATAYFAVAYGAINNIHNGGQWVVYITCIAAAIAHANIVLLCPLRPRQIWLRWLTITAGVATTLFVALAVHVNDDGDGMISRLAGACGIVAGCGTLALAILSRLNRRFVVSPAQMAGLSDITLICPVCRKKQTLALGGASCAECRVVIHVRVEEPKCATCGYSLLMLQSGVCPECGAAVPTGLSAAGPSPARPTPQPAIAI